MDKVRAIANVIWTQRFWVLSIIGTIVGAVCWNMAATDLDSEFTKRKSAIETAYKTVKGISGEANHPNDKVNEGDKAQAKQQRDFVLKVWQELYDRQRTEVLYWPETISKEFVEYMEKRQFGDSIKSDMRGFYHDYIETRFDALLEIVDAKKNTERGSRGGGGGYGGEMGGYGGGEMSGYGGGGATGSADSEEDDFLVLWLDQDKLQRKLAFKIKPSAMKVWVTQEDIWVYETLLNVIAKTNKAVGATRPDNTAVRAIMTLQVGSAAANPSTGQVLIPQAAEGGGGEGMGGYGGGEMGGYGGEMGGYGGEMGGMGGEMGGMGGEMGGYGGEMGGYGGGMGGGGDESLTANRYLGADGKPAAGDSGTYGTTEFRQLPIQMKLMMDQRKIPRVLIECANAALPIEVKQVRINANQSGTGVTGRSSRGAKSRGLKGVASDPNLAEVEIRGVVYIYNEPDTETLTVPGDDENALADGGI